MSETPKFEVIDRRKIKAQEEQGSAAVVAQEPEPVAPADGPTEKDLPVHHVSAGTPATGGGPRLVVNESRRGTEPMEDAGAAEVPEELPEAPTAEESREQKSAYDASAQRLEDLVRAQNPGAGAPPPVTFENLVQQFYVSAMIQMGAGTQEGQRPRVDILGARTTIDLLGVLAEKTKGNLSAFEDKALQTVLFECRMAFLELTSMISMQGVAPVPPPAGKH
jgi:hypothetical protein